MQNASKRLYNVVPAVAKDQKKIAVAEAKGGLFSSVFLLVSMKSSSLTVVSDWDIFIFFFLLLMTKA